MDFPYPKLKYRAADEYPGYVHVKVADPDEEAALGEGWHDTPGAMREASAAEKAAAGASAVAAAQKSRRGKA